jgi:asparagine synthetase B (glutamine-hydrolysing)
MCVDKVSMATSVEARVPFLDHRLMEYSMTIPQQFTIKNGEQCSRGSGTCNSPGSIRYAGNIPPQPTG